MCESAKMLPYLIAAGHYDKYGQHSLPFYLSKIKEAVSAVIKSMTHLNTDNSHHESGNSRVTRDSDMILKMMAAVKTNSFIKSRNSVEHCNWTVC